MADRRSWEKEFDALPADKQTKVRGAASYLGVPLVAAFFRAKELGLLQGPAVPVGRITKIVCPSCEGTGKFGVNVAACMWCGGDIRIPVATARRYADHIYMIAGGGFVAGDHDYEHKVEMEQRAAKIYALTGEAAPWVRSTTRAT